MTKHAFPPGFLWGVATSAFQIEGGADQDGRGESIWDRFAATPGRIEDASDARVACDHHRRWREDLALLRDLGVNAYRFSIAWPRVLPRGRGAPSAAGLAFYDRLVDALLEAGIRPFVTLHHWDLPQPLQDEGGWGSRATAEAFVELTEAVAMRLGDRVRHVATHNEPWCIATLGHERGEHAPGLRDPALALRVAHHVLLSHGWAVRALRRDAPAAEAGIVLNLVPDYPASPSAADREAARRFDGAFNRWYLDPLFRRGYPADVVEDQVRLGHVASPELPFVKDGDLRAICEPTDFLGVNYYSRAICRSEDVPEARNAPRTIQAPPPGALTEMGWEVFPQGLEDLLVRLHREYAPSKLYVTENGIALPDPAPEAGRVEDPRRVAFLREHVAACARAVAAGVPLAGYFHWSLYDNFEWGHGYTKKFGLYQVDFSTQRRTPKASAHAFRAIATANALDAPDDQTATAPPTATP
jgi:beta-glucosidase